MAVAGVPHRMKRAPAALGGLLLGCVLSLAGVGRAADCESGNCKVDFLWIIDNSKSMAAHEAALSAAADEMTNQLLTAGLDWRMAVAYTDLRAPDSAASTCPSAPGPGSHVLCPFVRDINLFKNGSAECAYTRPGTCGDGSERGFNGAHVAIERFQTRTGCESVPGGECFLRPDANLVLIFFTDTGDQTPASQKPPGQPDNSPQSWANYFRSQGVVSAHGIVCPLDPTPGNPSPCNDALDDPTLYERYRDLVADLGGVQGDVTDSHPAQLAQTIAEIINAPGNIVLVTTTTLPPPPCDVTEPGVCDDGDACTTDLCESAGCVHRPAAGFNAVTCVFQNGGLRPTVCERETAQGAVLQTVRKAKSLIDRSESSLPNRDHAAKLLGRAAAKLRKAAKVTVRLAKKRALARACAVQLEELLADVQSRIVVLMRQLKR